MVERDVGDDGEQGFDDVGGVQAAAEAHLRMAMSTGFASPDPFLRSLAPFPRNRGGEGGEDRRSWGMRRSPASTRCGPSRRLKVEPGEVLVGDLSTSIWMRSLTRTRWGECRGRYVARSGEDARQGGAVEPLPLVPAIRTEGKAVCGSSSAAARTRIWARLNLRRGRLRG